VLGGYFEDFTSEIGIWSAFVRYNQTLYGYPVPFYELTDYDPDYINVADLAFLIWKYITNNYPARTWAPDHPYIMNMAQEAFEVLEMAIDDAPATEFYENYFTVAGKTDEFFPLKDKLGWFCTASYLLGTELAVDLAEKIEEGAETWQPEQAYYMMYMTSEPYAYSIRSTFSALNAAEWFAEVARASPDVKEAIRQLPFGHTGQFSLVDTTEKTHYLFRHEQTDRLYRVRRDSLQGGKPIPKTAKDDLFLMNIRYWLGDWWMSGVLINLPLPEAERTAYRQSLVQEAWLYDDDKLADIRDAEREQEAAFLEFFGNRLVIHSNEKEYLAATAKLMTFTNDRNQKRDVQLTPEREAEIDKRRSGLSEFGLPPEYRRAKDIAIFYHSGVGQMIMQNVKADAIDLLTAPDPTVKQTKELYEFMVISMNPHLSRYLLDTYGTRNFHFPIVASRVDALRDIDFLWRFHSPEEFDPEFPMMGVL